jgi:hypothetical protein
MGLSFFETMRGELVDREGVAHPTDFAVKAESASLARLFLTGQARLAGVVRARPWAADLPCEGTLLIDPLRGRRMVYDLEFVDPEGHRWRLLGQKDLSLLRPVHSMTRLRTELTCDGQPVACGMITFDLKDLPSFVRSAQWPTTIPRVEMTPRPLDDRQEETLRAFAEALIVPGRRVPAVDDTTHTLVRRLLPRLPASLMDMLRAGLGVLDGWCVVATRRRFAKHLLERRRALLDAISAWRPLGEGLVYLLGMPIKAAHFSRRDYLDAIGFEIPPTPAREAEPRWMARVTPAGELPADSTVEVDVVVIGTGAGGGPAAAVLAERGLAVALLEEGEYHRRDAFAGPPEERLLRFWRQGGMMVTVGNVPVSIPVGRMVGGSTAINSGTSFRTPDAVLEEWRDAGLPEDFAPDRFARWLDPVEAELEISPGDPRWLGGVAEIVARGAGAMGLGHGALPRDAPGCDGQGACTVGCPTDAKRSTNISYVPRALRAGAWCFTGMRVRRLLMHGSRAVGVDARGEDTNGAPRRLQVRARAVVVACGSLYSPMLLADSGIRLPQLGRNLTIHPALGQFAMCGPDLRPWRAIPQSYGIEGLVDPRIRCEGFYAPPSLSAPVVPAFGAELTRWMDAGGRVGQFGFMVRDRAAGSVHRGSNGRPIIRYDLLPDVVDLMHRGSAALAEVLLRGGALEVMTGIGNVRTTDEARALAKRRVRASDFRAMGFHPLGTCRMTVDAARGVVDSDQRVFGTENLYVMDGSTVPSSLGVNPQVTIMAMATRGAERLATALGA